jgi:hypothetical protein
MKQIQLINIEFNNINGFIFDILWINSKSLLGIHFGIRFLIIYIFFFELTVFDKST